ncbi:MAG: ACP S-malonyltransferase [Saprospiraceae bacterium]|nr:ACP S-malonyltransferase [Saprospiraceae bacterium]
MKIAYIFPGQASQFVGMGKDLYENSDVARQRFAQADGILGFKISQVMFEGTADDLKQTRVTQPAVFLHSVIKAEIFGESGITAVAGHSLGEFSALVSNQALCFEDGLNLVRIRAESMQKACEKTPGTMAAIVGLDDQIVENICEEVDGVVISANYNCPGQLVISGEKAAVQTACQKLSEAGARRAIELAVGGAFHSPLMEPAAEELAKAVEATRFSIPSCPIYQNVDGMPQQDPEIIKNNLVRQLTSPVRWTGTIQNMAKDGINVFVEVGGTGKVLQGMVKRILSDAETRAL